MDADRRWIALAVWLLGCGRAASEPGWVPPNVELGSAFEVSGARLHPFAFHAVPDASASDAASEPPIRSSLFYDQARGETCRFAPADDGSQRCFPSATASVPFPNALFADAACTVPLYSAGFFAGEAPRYVALDDEQDCASGERIYQLGPENLDEPYIGPDCQFRLQNPGRTFRIGARIPNDAFVRAAEIVHDTDSDGALAARQLDAEDGSASLLGFYDRTRAVACDAVNTPAGLVCVPSPSYQQTYWSGSPLDDGRECWDLVVFGNPCAPPRFGLVRGTSGTELSIHRVQPAAEVRAPSDDLAACIASAETFATAPLFAIGDEVPPASFPPLTTTAAPGSRLHADWVTSPDRALVLPQDEGNYRLFDGALGADCYLTRAADDSLRCIPRVRSISRFADAACSSPLLEPFSDAASAPQFVGVFAGDRFHVFEAGDQSGAPHAGDTFQIVYGDTTSCERVADDGSPWFPAGAEVPPERFVEYRLEEL